MVWLNIWTLEVMLDWFLHLKTKGLSQCLGTWCIALAIRLTEKPRQCLISHKHTHIAFVAKWQLPCGFLSELYGIDRTLVSVLNGLVRPSHSPWVLDTLTCRQADTQTFIHSNKITARCVWHVTNLTLCKLRDQEQTCSSIFHSKYWLLVQTQAKEARYCTFVWCQTSTQRKIEPWSFKKKIRVMKTSLEK